MDEKKFYCYSIQLKDFLKLQGLRYNSCGCHKKTGNRFWIYNSSSSLDEALANWNIYKKTFWKEKDQPC